MSIVTPDGILNVENATLRVPSIEVQGVNVTTALSTLSNVGIGTASPDERLHVHGPDAGFILQSNLNSATMEIGGPGGAVMDLKGAFTDDYDLRIKTTGTGGVISSVGEANHLVFGAASGYTGFGVASPQFKIDAQGSAGVDAVSNPITHNSVILYDDQESTTTFSGTSGGSSSGRDTTNKYYELNSLTQTTVGYIHWPIQLPNSFTAEFERYSGGGTGGHNIIFSFFNTSAPTTDGDNGGYRVYISERYGGAAAVAIKRGNTELKHTPLVGYANATWQKVVVSYDRGSISVSFNNKVLLTYKDTQQADAYTGKYMGFLGTTDSQTNYHRVRNVKITSGSAKWLYTETDTSNASTLVYLSGNVGIGTQTPTELLEVSGNVKVSSGYHLMGDGGLISNIATTLQSISDQGNTVSNTIQFTNTTTGLTSTGNVEVTNNKFFKGDGGLISNIATTLGDIVDQGNTTSNTIIFSSSNVGWRSSGNVEVINNKFFKGDGGLISNIATTLQAITDQGNVASNTLQFTNTDVAFITTANVGIANSAPTVSLSVGSNLHVDEYGSNVLDIVGNVSMSNLTLSGFGIEASYGLQHVTAENATTAETITLTHASKALDITSNVEMGGTLKFDSNAAITSVTGDVINQGFMEQPTQGLTNYRTYIEGHGTYEASASSYDSTYSLFPWEAFDSDTSTRWTISTSDDNYNASSGEWDATAIAASPTINTIDVAGTRHSGHWLQIKLPYQIVLSHSNVFPQTTDRAPKDGVILGSNDGEDWYELQRFTGKTYTSGQWTQIDVNAETSYQYFRMCITKNAGNAKVELTEWRLFAKDRITKLADNILLNGSIASDTLNTGYVKWPKVPLLADSYNGYEVSASSEINTTQYMARGAFNGLLGDSTYGAWGSAFDTFDATTGAAHSSNAALFDGVRCEWIQLKLPRNKKIKLSHFVIAPRTQGGSSAHSPEDAPKEGAMYGSNDGTTWTKLTTYSGLTYGGAAGDQSEKVVVRSDTKYQYFRLTATKRNIATATGTWVVIAELGLFERSLGVAQNPDKATLQVGGSLGLAKGSEIFAGDDIVMELDGPHDRPLVRYPEIKFSEVDAVTTTQGGYTLTSSARYASGNSAYPPSNVFDGNLTTISSAWVSQYGGFTNPANDGSSHVTSATSSDTFNPGTGAINGPWLKFQLPSPIRLSYIKLYRWSGSVSAAIPSAGTIYGSNDGSNFTTITAFTGIHTSLLTGPYVFNLNLTQTYAHYVIHFTSVYTVYNSHYLGVQELEYWGTEEGDVSTDLTFSPVYNKPGTQQLEVYWDANDRSSYMGTGTTVNDLSGNGVKGTIGGSGNTFDTTYSAWKFTTSSSLKSPALPISGDYVHSMSLWFRLTSEPSAWSSGRAIMALHADTGISVNSEVSAIVVQTDGTLRDNFWGNDIDYTSPFKMNTWHHVVFTYSGTSGTTDTRKIYVDTKLLTDAVTSGGDYGDPLNLPNNSKFAVGEIPGVGLQGAGDFANARLFTKALQATQVKELYDWQKDFFFGTKSTMTLTKGNLGLGASSPTDRLEVVGRVKADSSKIPTGVDRNNTVIRSETGPHDRPLVKYPEIKMTANSSGGYVASASSQYAGGLYDIWKAYDGERTHAGSPSYYYSSSHAVYSTTNGAYAPGSNPSYSTTSSGTAYAGEYVQMQFPTPIKLSYVRIVSPDGGGTYNKNAPKQGVICGSNDGTTWTTISAYSDITYYTLGASADIQASSNVAYKYIRLVATHIEGVGSTGWFVIEELEYYGYEEGDVSTDVTWSSVYNKPGTQHLNVYWDANDSNSYAGSGTTVTDLSGNGVTGTITGTNGFDSEYNAWVFDGSAYISGTLTHTTGAWAHTVSAWVYRDATSSTTNQHIFHFGGTSTNTGCALRFQLIGGRWVFRYYFFANDVLFYATNIGESFGNWLHITATYDGGSDSGVVNGSYGLARNLYVNGVPCEVHSSSSPGSLNLGTTSSTFYAGNRQGSALQHDLIGKMANARVYSKALSADQVRELYEYDAPRFGHRQNLVSLHKGNLGVGVSAPTARLEIAGDERIQEYPPKGMTDYETYIEGHGVFRAIGEHTFSGGSGYTYDAFNKIVTTGDFFYSLVQRYGTNGSPPYYYTGSNNIGGYDGEWLGILFPYDVKIKKIGMTARNGEVTSAPKAGYFLGTVDNGNTWETIGSFSNKTSTNFWLDSGLQAPTFDVNANNQFYNGFVFVCTEASNYYAFTLGEIRIFGTPASSSLEDGHMTLGKALTLPRVSGHPAGAETPRAESLIVHYDTTVDSVKSGSTAVDISGEGNNGTLSGGATYSSTDRALVFDGTGDFVKGTISSSLSGNHPYTFSLWIKPDAIQSNFIAVFEMGNRTTNQSCGLYLNGGSIVHLVFANNLATSTSVVPNQWIHITGTYTSGSRKIYADGVLLATDTYSSLNIGATEMTLGANNDDLQKFDGSISNFKLYDVALTAEEVAMEYALGRTGKSLNLTDTSLCLGGTVPRAQLDVRGSGLITGNLGIGTDNPGIALDVGSSLSNPQIGRDYAVGSVHDADKRDAIYFGRWDGTGRDLLGMKCRVDTHSNLGYGSYSNQSKIEFYTWGNNYAASREVMCIRGDGNVGIGTATPPAKLSVIGSTGSMSTAARVYFRWNDYIGGSGGAAYPIGGSGNWVNMGIYANGAIVSSSYFVSHAGTASASDTRIKKNIVDANDSECLETLRLLKPKKYEYKDTINRGEEPVWGFIAQEVKETLPHATQLRQDVLPNIYELANVSSSNVITFTNFNTSNLESNATTLVRTMGIDGEQHDVHLAEVIDTHTIRVEEDLSEWIGSVDAEGNVITEITTTTVTPEEYEALEDKTGYVANISGYQNANVSISVEEYNALEDTAGYEQVVQDYTKTSTTRVGNQLFVYGQEVDDFVFLKKEAIWTVATAALQEVDRQLQAEKAKVADLLARVTALENA